MPTERPSSSPRIAVLVPCFDDGPVLEEALRSLSGEEPFEVVVVDDGSSDAPTLAALDRLEADGAWVVHQPNTGLSGARMTALRATRAPYVFPLDADDLAEPAALRVMADMLDADPAAAVCFGDYLEFGTGEELVRRVPVWLDPYRVAYTNEYPVSALFRRSALERAGGWKPISYGYEDWDLWMGLAENGARGVHAGAGRITYRRRLHGERMLTTAKRHHRELYRMLRARHPQLFGEIAAHRARSDLGRGRKHLYPLVYGGRRRFRVERHLKVALDRAGVWTLRR